jgi:FtsP/CotA-like multicopper oxidase with cupredoxin domain
MQLGSLAPSIRVCALLGVALLTNCSRPQSATEAAAVPVVRASGGVAHVELDAVLAKNGTPAFAFGARVGVAPTIRLEPGERIEVALHNGMHAQGARSNDVNLHFHGLAVSPLAPGDDSLTMLAHPGQTLHYLVRVPANHPPGLYWYHPHVHGQTFWQVAHGMSGAIVIEGMQRHLPALAAMRERIVILRQSPTGGDINEASNAPTSAEALEDADGNPCRPEIALRPTIDGLATERFAIGRGERQFFRVVNASASRYFDLSIDGVPLHLVALDGVPLDAYPGAPAVATVRHVSIAPAGRAEFVVEGPAAPATIRSRCVDSGPAGDAQPATILGRLEVDPGATPSPKQPLAAATKLAHNVMDDPPPPPALVRTVRLTEDAKHFYIDGKSFDMQAMMRAPAFVAHAGTVEEWNVVNDTDEAHDFHVHQVHFAVESVDGRTEPRRHWVDTVSVPSRIHHWNRTEPGRARLLVDFRNPVVRGTFLLHCHILDHEDRGMMAKIEVL